MTERRNGTQMNSTTARSATRLDGTTPKSRPVISVREIFVDRAAGKRPEQQRDTEIDRAGRDRHDDRLQRP